MIRRALGEDLPEDPFLDEDQQGGAGLTATSASDGDHLSD